MSPDTGQWGLTLIELMITLVIVAVTLGVAAPAMRVLLHGNQLRVEAGRLVGALNLARSEAIARNLPVTLCPSSMAHNGQAVCAGTYTDGWIVFANLNRDAVVDPGTDEVLRAFAPSPAGYSFTNRAGTRAVTDLITYLPDGSSRRNRTLLLCAPGGNRFEPWSVVLNIVGRPRVARGAGVCP